MDMGVCQSTMQLILTRATLMLTKAFTNYFYLSGRQYWHMHLIKKLTNLHVHLTKVIFNIKQMQTCTPNFNWVFGLFQVYGILILTLHLDIFIVMRLLCVYNLKSQMRCYQQWNKTRVTKSYKYRHHCAQYHITWLQIQTQYCFKCKFCINVIYFLNPTNDDYKEWCVLIYCYIGWI
jgi:hypothetical protein